MAQVSSRRRSLALVVALVLAAGAQAQEMAPLHARALQAGWDGRYGEALQLIDQHLAGHPDDRAARMDRARFLAWSGNYAAAIATLDAMDADDAEATALRARIHGWAGRREAALALNAPLYAAATDDYDAAWTQALAARLGEWPHEALPPLATVREIKPDEADTRDLARAVRLPLFSSVGVPASYYEDSDDIEIRSIGAEANLRVSDQWRLLGQATWREHASLAGGPFAPVGGGDHLDERRTQVGVRFAASPQLAVEGWLGRSELDGAAFDGAALDDGETIGRLALTHQASDALRYALAIGRDRIAFSPRALSLGVIADSATADLRWTPGFRDTLAMQVAFDDFSDGNRRHALSADYRHAVYRGGMVSLDLGGQAEWQRYRERTDNGYYSPRRYARIAPLLGSYFQLGDEAGLYLQATLGVQRDDSFDSWKRAADVSAEFTLGIYSHWQLVATAGYSQRLNEFGRYDGNSVGLALRYRFCAFRADRCPAVP